MASRGQSQGPDIGLLFRDLWEPLLVSLSNPLLTGQYLTAKKKFDNVVAECRFKAGAGSEKEQRRLCDAVRGCVLAFWEVNFENSWITSSVPPQLFGEVGCEIIGDLLEAALERCPAGMTEGLRNGTALVDWASQAMAKAGLPSRNPAKAASLLEWWREDICTLLWGATGVSTGSGAVPDGFAVKRAATSGNLPLLERLVSRGAPVDGPPEAVGAPLQAAFDNLQYRAFSRLLELGASPHHLDFFSKPAFASDAEAGKPNADVVTMLQALVAAHPSLLAASFRRSRAFGAPHTFLGVCLKLGAPVLAVAALDAGAPIWFGSESATFDSAKRGTFKPTLVTAMTPLNLPVLRALVTKHKALEGWREKYDRSSKIQIASALNKAIVQAYGSRRCSASSEIIGLLLDGPDPFNHSWILDEHNIEENNVVLDALFSGEGLHHMESRCIEVLKRFRAAGFNVVSMRKSHVDAGHVGFNLFALAARLNRPQILEYAHSIGVPVDERWPVVARTGQEFTGSALNLAIKYKQPLPLVRSLLKKYGAKAAYPELGATHQPIFELLYRADRYSDEEALPLLEALIERDPGLLDLPCYASRARNLAAKDEPLGFCISGTKLKCFGLLLRKLPAARAMAENFLFRPSETSTSRAASLAQMLTAGRRWDFLDSLLRHTKCTVGDTADPSIPPVAWQVQMQASHRTEAPPRALVAAVNARARAELEEVHRELAETSPASAPSTAASTAAPSVASVPTLAQSNAFEDPSVKLLSAKEAKKRAKKRAKRKAKKQAAQANAGAGAVPAADDDSDDDSSSDDEAAKEPDDNLVDSRYAPSVDVMFAAMGLGPGGVPKDDPSAGKK